MGQLLVKSYGENDAAYAIPKSSVAALSNGGTAYSVADPNRAGVGGGSGSGGQYQLIYYQAPGSNTISLVGNWNYSDQNSNTSHYVSLYSMAIDNSNNLHVVYRYTTAANQQSLRYRKITWSGTAYSIGAEEIITAYTANRYFLSVDIDIPGSEVTFPQVVTCERTGATVAAYQSVTKIYLRGATAGTWQATTLKTQPGYLGVPDVSIGCRQSAAVGGNPTQTVVAFNPGPPSSGTADTGDTIWQFRANSTVNHDLVAGSVVTLYTGINKGLNGGYRNYHVFNLDTNVFLIHGVIQSNLYREWLAIIENSATANTFTVRLAPKVVSSTTAKYYRFSRKIASASNIRNSPGHGTIAVWNVTAGGVWLQTHEYDQSGTSWSVNSSGKYTTWSKGYTVASNFLVPWAGDRGRFTTAQLATVMTPHLRNNAQNIVQRVYSWRRPLTPKAAVTFPLANQITGTSEPEIQVTVTGTGIDAAALRSRARIQISQTSDFTGISVDYTQPRTAENYYSSTPSVVRVSLANMPLFQGIWYARAQMIDMLGGVSGTTLNPWSAVTNFLVSHPPNAQFMSPVANSVLVYNASGVFFSWTFKDAYVHDSQTAYQVDVYDADTETLQYTTGKVLDDSNTAQVVLDSGLVDHNLQWTVTLWDEDDVSSGAVNGGVFYLTVPPAPVITFPFLDGDDINTAIPTISWTPGLTGTKTQTSYRLMIHRLSDDKLMLDTRVVSSANTNYIVGPGILRNTQSYKITLSVVDSSNLQSTVTRYFDTVWTPPATRPAPVIHTDRVNTDGFVSVEIDTTDYDVDLIGWNIYRRALDNEPEWILIQQSVSTDPVFVLLDYMCPSGLTVEYAVTQVVDRFGDTMESTLALTERFQAKVTAAEYWLIDNTVPELSTVLPTATDDSYTREQEEEVYIVAGRGRVVETGEDLGVVGSVSCQFRDRDMGWYYHENYNLLKNSNLLVGPDGLVGGWTQFDNGTLSPGLISVDETPRTPGPGNRPTRLSLTARKLTATSNQISVGFQQDSIQSPYVKFNSGRTYFVSMWVRIPAAVSGYQLRIEVQWKTGATIRQTDFVSVSTDTAQIGTGTPGVLEMRTIDSEVWIRIGKSVVVPGAWAIDAASFRLYLTSLGNTILNPVTIEVEGLTVTNGSDPVAYFNGDTPGASWINQVNVDPAYNPGSLQARWVRQRLETLKFSGHELWIRTPFGDIWPVYIGTLNVSRVAGVGTNEFVDVEIPYSQVAQ